MSKMRMINTDFWTDSWVVDQLNPLDRYLFIYLFTNSHTTIAGVYELSLRVMSFETGITTNDLSTMINRLQGKVKYVNGWVVLRNGIKNQNYHSPKIKTGIDMALQKCPPELIELLRWPDDYETAKPEGSMQTQLIAHDINHFDGKNERQRDPKSVVRTHNNGTYPQLSDPTTPSSVKYGIGTLSHSNSNSNSNSNTVVRNTISEHVKVSKTGTTGLKKSGNKYLDVNALYEDLADLVNEKYKGWYCKTFHAIGRQKVQRIASEARADATEDKRKLFSHMLKEVLRTAPA